MNEIYPGKYRDELGEENITIENDGRNLRTIIRGVQFAGTMFDDFEPQWQEDDSRRDLFSFSAGSLCNCVFEFEMPVTIVTPDGEVEGKLHVFLQLGKPFNVRGGLDEEIVKLKLFFEEQAFESGGTKGWFADELQELLSALPPGYFIKCCYNCALSEYYPAGFGFFGGLACFRDNKAEFLKVRGKTALFGVWDSRTGYVQETYLCSEFQRAKSGKV